METFVQVGYLGSMASGCSAHSSCSGYRCKRRREGPSAVRDFPPGCGGLPRQAVGSGAHVKHAVRRLPDVSGAGVSSNQRKDRAQSSTESMDKRNKVKETLDLFRATCKELLQDEKQKRVDLKAAKLLKNEGKYINTRKIIGPVPGVKVGDKFQYRMELCIIGLHHKVQNGIDYLEKDGRVLAASIVASGDYDRADGSGTLFYMGEGGNVTGRRAEGIGDQKLVRGNLALKNSMEVKNPVRVIRRQCFSGCSLVGRGNEYNFVYDGLYVVRKWWQERGSHGKLVFMYELVRKSDQPEVERCHDSSRMAVGTCGSSRPNKITSKYLHEVDDSSRKESKKKVQQVQVRLGRRIKMLT